MLLNVGSGGGAAAAGAPAAGGAAAGGAAPEEEKKEEAKEEGEFRTEIMRSVRKKNSELTSVCVIQRRKSRTRTWASVSSTKRFPGTSGEFNTWSDIHEDEGGGA
jgi:hypothetical protein